ncbi:VTT domain-containing protein [Paucibacter sp. TC2R-5]|uniref:TVP38/TMEM64 family protein n=1 Tax=Paucibacter sp. TC2R-5 TaxID=2893555 RepID=UPI0021E4347C|nr:VTT domain-containing protein [Paucibacter sp. TC2R-5]MCV2358794.1 VTT domain-containing protein [Paucibacter sp. TC2R-5]
MKQTKDLSAVKPGPAIKHLKLRLVLLALLLASLLALAWIWSGGKLDLAAGLTELRSSGAELGPGLAMLGAALGLTLAVPLSVLSLLLIAALGPWQGFVCSVGAALLSSAASHAIGRSLGHQALQGLAGPKVRQVSEQLGGRGVWAVITLRLLPLAPFAVVNMVAGATHIRLRDMLLGTAIGMTPSTLVMAFFMERLLLAVQQAGREDWLWLGLITLLVLLLAFALAMGLRRWQRRHQS